MSYCTIDDIKKQIDEKVLIQLSNDSLGGDLSEAAVDESIVNECITSADAYIDGKLRGRYTLPLPSPSEQIKSISVNLAIYYLYKRRFQTKVPTGIYSKFTDSDKALNEIQKGTITLGINTLFEPARSKFKSNKTSRDRLFGKEFMNRY